jgi:chromosome segregation ATPase
MGRQALVTLEHVRAAVAALQAEGKAVSSRSVREKLGNVGSMGTINKLLQQALNAKEPIPDSLRQLPPDLQRSILDFADQRAEDARTQIAKELINCRLEMTDLATENEKLTAIIEELQSELAATAGEVARAEGQISQLTTELTAAREETTAERLSSQAIRMELVKLQLRVDTLSPLEHDLQEAHARFATQRDACIRVEQANAVLETQLSTLLGRVNDLKNDLAESRANGAELGERAKELQEMLEQKRAALALVERELAVENALKTARNLAKPRRKIRMQPSPNAQK